MEDLIIPLIIGLLVATAFGAFVRKKKRSSGQPSVIIVNAGGDDEPRGPSALVRVIQIIVSLAAGLAATGFVITQFIEPEIGPVDPFSYLSIGMFAILSLIILGIIRAFSR
jgi:H+/Cl- antiporter ClcA